MQEVDVYIESFNSHVLSASDLANRSASAGELNIFIVLLWTTWILEEKRREDLAPASMSLCLTVLKDWRWDYSSAVLSGNIL